MTTRDSMNQFLSRCEETLAVAQNQYEEGLRQGHYHDYEYTQAQQLLEECYNDLEAVYNSASGEQKDRLHRMRLRIQQLQNQMTLLDHH